MSASQNSLSTSAFSVSTDVIPMSQYRKKILRELRKKKPSSKAPVPVPSTPQVYGTYPANTPAVVYPPLQDPYGLEIASASATPISRTPPMSFTRGEVPKVWRKMYSSNISDDDAMLISQSVVFDGPHACSIVPDSIWDRMYAPTATNPDYNNNYLEQIQEAKAFPYRLPVPGDSFVADTTVLNPLFDILTSEDDVLHLMHYTPEIMEVIHSFFPKDITPAVNLAIELYKRFTYSEVLAFFELFKVKPSMSTPHKTRAIRTLNSKLLNNEILRFSDHIIAHSPQDTYVEQIFEFYTKLNRTVDSANDTCTSLTKLTDQFSAVLEKFEPKADLLAEVPSFYRRFIDNCKAHAPALMAQFYNLLTEEDKSKWFISLGTITSMLGINKPVIDYLLNKIMPSLSEQMTNNTVKLLAIISTFMGKYSPVKLLLQGKDCFSTVREIKAIQELKDIVTGIAEEWGLTSSPEVELANLIKQDVTKLIADLLELEHIQQTTPNKFLFVTDFKRLEDN